MLVFCADLGGTKSSAALFDRSGQMIASTVTGPGAASLGAEVSIAALDALWDALTRDGAATRAETVAALGIAGIGLGAEVTAIRNAMRGFHQTICVNDGYGALLDATSGAPGCLIMVGTGIAALRLDDAGLCHVSSGWGFPGGDQGGGAWIGLQAAGALTAHLDGLPEPTLMTKELARDLMSITGTSASEIMTWITTATGRDYARLAPIIAASKDPVAVAILERAGHHIAQVARALGGPALDQVCLSGGLARAVVDACAAAAPDITFRTMSANPLQGLLRLATGSALPEQLSPRPGLGSPDYDAGRSGS